MRNLFHIPSYLILLLPTLLLAGCIGILHTPPTAADYCGIDPALLEPEAAGKSATKTVLDLWATAERQYCWRAYAPLVAANQHPELGLSVRATNLKTNEGPLTDQLMDLAALGQAPDIAFVFHEQAVRLGEAGHLTPLDECRQRPEFESIPQPFWTGFSVDNQAWGIPMDIEVMLFYYNKALLRQLGWTSTQIEELPARTASGDFTLADLVATAREAVAQGVVEPGMAFIPNRSQKATIESIYVDAGGKFSAEQSNSIIATHPIATHPIATQHALEKSYSFLASLSKHQLLTDRLAVPNFGDWGNKLLLRDAATHNRYLFWHAYSSELPRMAMDYTEIAVLRTFPEAQTPPIDQRMGPISGGFLTRILRSFREDEPLHTTMPNSWDSPSSTAALNQQIGVALLPSHTKNSPGHALLINSGQYVIFSQAATGREHQEVACNLLATTQASGLYAQHTPKSGHPTFSPQGIFLPEWLPTEFALDRLTWPPPRFPKVQEYRDTLVEISISVERGERTASAAADVAVERLRDIFGSQLVVE